MTEFRFPSFQFLAIEDFSVWIYVMLNFVNNGIL